MASLLGSILHTSSLLLLLMTSGQWRKQIIPSSCVSAAPTNPHQPTRQTWQVISGTSDMVWEVTSNDHPPWTWWPSLYPDLCQLAAGLETWDIPTTDPARPLLCNSGTCACPTGGIGGWGYGCSHPQLRAELKASDFYVCPRDSRDRDTAWRCGGLEVFYCKAWGCETTGTTYWRPTSSWDWIRVTRVAREGAGIRDSRCSGNEASGFSARRPGTWTGSGPCTNFTCNPLNITFTHHGRRQDNAWLKGRQWGLRMYVSGSDAGLTFKIKLQIGTAGGSPLGPNKVLADQRAPRPSKPLSVPVQATPSPRDTVSSPASVSSTPLSQTTSGSTTGQRLLDLIKGGFEALNSTHPNLTDSCWICLQAGPPYYEGVAVNGSYYENKSPSQCNWGRRHMLTLPEVNGQGICLGTPSASDKARCLQTISISPNSSYLIPEKGTRWACRTGLTPCVSTQAFNNSQDFCVMVRVFPRLIYHGNEDFEEAVEGRTRYRREPVTLTLAVLLGAGVLAGVGTGAAALVEGPKQMASLESAITQDLRAVEQSIEALEKSLTSLSEVVLQNRRGLDLLFLKEGGLCAALKEECCFYADHTGVVRDSMNKLKERLKAREKRLQDQQGWFEGWYAKAPWLTTLISTLAGPLIVLLLVITIGPCVLNRLTTFLQGQIGAVKLMIMRQHYEK
ncbi:syncytin-2 [Saccopteryx leptura]|uniref:syncytin-2 n=1 Tax=Saccopteryx leptura TaxID=249018 RepID=UPI00339CFCD8